MDRATAKAELMKRGLSAAEADAKLDAYAAKARGTAVPVEAPKAEGKPKAPAKAAPAKAEAPKVAPAKVEPAPVPAPEPVEDLVDAGSVPFGLGGARHRMEDREDRALLLRNSYLGTPSNAQDVALAVGNRAAAARRGTEALRGSLDLERIGNERRAALDAKRESRRDPLAEEITSYRTTRPPTYLDAARADWKPLEKFRTTVEDVRDRAVMRAAVEQNPARFGLTLADIDRLDEEDIGVLLTNTDARKRAGL